MKKTTPLFSLILLAATGCAGPQGLTNNTSSDNTSPGDVLRLSSVATPGTRERLIAPGQEDTEGKQNGIAYRLTGEENDVFSITFTYAPERRTDPAAVIATNLTVTGGGELHAPIVIAYQTVLPEYTGITQKFRRTDPDADIHVVMDVEGREGVKIRITNDRPLDKTPVGTIVHSLLPWEKYVKVMRDRPEFDAGESRWAPCDGRGIAGSELAGLWGKDNVPDLRGMFLRGLDRFDAKGRESTGAAPAGQGDPGEKQNEAGARQGHNVGGHSHKYKFLKRLPTPHGPPKEVDPGEEPPRDSDERGKRWSTETLRTTGGPRGETRPRNVAVYYYIKIN